MLSLNFLLRTIAQKQQKEEIENILNEYCQSNSNNNNYINDKILIPKIEYSNELKSLMVWKFVSDKKEIKVLQYNQQLTPKLQNIILQIHDEVEINSKNYSKAFYQQNYICDLKQILISLKLEEDSSKLSQIIDVEKLLECNSFINFVFIEILIKILACHEQKIFHGNICTENIVLGHDMKIYLKNFKNQKEQQGQSHLILKEFDDKKKDIQRYTEILLSYLLKKKEQDINIKDLDQIMLESINNQLSHSKNFIQLLQICSQLLSDEKEEQIVFKGTLFEKSQVGYFDSFRDYEITPTGINIYTISSLIVASELDYLVETFSFNIESMSQQVSKLNFGKYFKSLSSAIKKCIKIISPKHLNNWFQLRSIPNELEILNIYDQNLKENQQEEDLDFFDDSDEETSALIEQYYNNKPDEIKLKKYAKLFSQVYEYSNLQNLQQFEWRQQYQYQTNLSLSQLI